MTVTTITAHGVRYEVEDHGFEELDAEADRQVGLAVIADELASWHADTAAELAAVAELGRATAMQDWYRPDGDEAGFTISVVGQ